MLFWSARLRKCPTVVSWTQSVACHVHPRSDGLYLALSRCLVRRVDPDDDVVVSRASWESHSRGGDDCCDSSPRFNGFCWGDQAPSGVGVWGSFLHLVNENCTFFRGVPWRIAEFPEIKKKLVEVEEDPKRKSVCMCERYKNPRLSISVPCGPGEMLVFTLSSPIIKWREIAAKKKKISPSCVLRVLLFKRDRLNHGRDFFTTRLLSKWTQKVPRSW